jgi:2-amino-4-hydroxy-6-hydroxymethyldihydropteridine diphosphokinase
MKIQRSIFLSLGSNLGNRFENLQNSVDLLDSKVGSIKSISKIFQTPSWGYKGENFFNICLEIRTSLSPEALLKASQSIEQEIGRKPKEGKEYQDRVIDIDILFFEDEIIFQPGLIVPHPKALERKFVLLPLAEIAENFRHPITGDQIKVCLANCVDDSEIKPIDLSLKRPVSLEEKFNYIAIEGNIGAGKTSLSHLISDDFNAKIILERFADNPFLPQFYKDQERYAFPLEMSFLADRYQQLSEDLSQYDLFKNFIVSDYYIFKSLIFAQVTLQPEEFRLYRRMFDLMYKEIRKPDLYIFLYQNTERLLEQIKSRGREYEQNIEASYLKKIHKGYSSFIQTEKDLNTLIIDVSELDFVKNPEDYQVVIERIRTHSKQL